MFYTMLRLYLLLYNLFIYYIIAYGCWLL